MPKLVYVIGEPGSGKSTLIKRVVQGRGTSFLGEPKKEGLITYYELPGLILLGSYSESRGGYGGTDALPMNAMPAALKFLAEAPRRWPGKHILAEGDRLSSAKFFQEAELQGYELKVFFLQTSQNTLDGRYDARGSNQDRSFLKSRKTKCRRLAGQAGAEKLDSENQGDLHSNLSLLLNLLADPG